MESWAEVCQRQRQRQRRTWSQMKMSKVLPDSSTAQVNHKLRRSAKTM